MAKKIAKKTLPSILILGIIGAMILSVNFFSVSKANADNADTSATVNNTAPVWASNATCGGSYPCENPASYVASPTNAGSDVTFLATATDNNGEQWRLIVCKTAGTSGGDCDGGASDRWCRAASLSNSGSASTCAYTTPSSGNNDTYAWYAYACDSANGCSTVSQGNGSDNNATPFAVNDRPAFTVYSDNTPKNPDQVVTFSTTSSDGDTSDTVTLYVCKTNSFTAPATCNGGEWCHSSAGSSDPTCNYDDSDDIIQDKDWDAYGFVVDNHGFEASGGSQGTNSTMTISNVAPSISASSIQLLDTDESGDLSLTAEQTETTGFKVKFTVVDKNSCLNASSGNEIASSLINVRMTEKTSVQCDTDGEDNNNNCYANAQAGTGGSCTQDVGSCAGANDDTVTWTCVFPLQYHADATVVNSQKASYNWSAAVKATDDNSSDTGLIDDADGNEMGMFMSYDLNSVTISYGALDPGNDSAEQSTVLEATGNVGLDENLSGTDMTYLTNTIGVAQQKYALSSGGGWTGTALSTSPTESELNCSKTTVTGSPATQNTYWVLRVPNGQPSGSYTGINTIAGITGESANW